MLILIFKRTTNIQKISIIKPTTTNQPSLDLESIHKAAQHLYNINNVIDNKSCIINFLFYFKFIRKLISLITMA